MEPAKYFDNVIIGQFVLTGINTKVYVNGNYLTITDPDDIEDPIFGFGMDVNGGMVPFDYRTVEHILAGDNTITLDVYNKAMSGGGSEEAAPEEEAPEEKEKTDETTMKLKPMIEKAVSKAQQRLFGTALSVKRGDTEKTQVSKDVVTLAKSLSDKELAKFAGTKHKDLPEKKKEETNEDLGSAQKNLDKARAKRAKASAEEAEAAAKVAKEEEKMAKMGKMSEDIGDTNTISEPYMFQVGDIVNNVNPNCTHFGSIGIVKNLIALPDEMGTLVKYTVTNSGDTFSPGDVLTKTMDQLSLVGPEAPDEMDYDDDYDSGDYDDWDIVSGDGLDDDDEYGYNSYDDEDED